MEIIRAAVAAATNPLRLFSFGKDSTALLHRAQKAFYPAPLPSSPLPVDAKWSFRHMHAHRAGVAAQPEIRPLVPVNETGWPAGANP